MDRDHRMAVANVPLENRVAPFPSFRAAKQLATAQKGTWEALPALAQVGRLRFLAHGVKEGLVGKVTEWPGVHAAEGYWFDRTQEYAARNRGEDFGRLTYATREELI